MVMEKMAEQRPNNKKQNIESALRAEEKKGVREFDIAWTEFFKDKPEPKTDEEGMKEQEEFCHWYNNVRKQTDTEMTPVEMGDRIMEFRRDDDRDVTLKELLVPETEEIMKLKVLRDEAMDAYADVTFPIESNIAEYFLENRHITDKDVKKALKNFIREPFKEFDPSEFPIEYEIQAGAIDGAQEKAISLHELGLVVECLVVSIENRDFLPDKQAYLKWICAFLDYFSEAEIRKLEQDYRHFGLKNRLPKFAIDALIKTFHPEKGA